MDFGMMKVLSLPASMQQELAARALRACVAAEAAMASLRAECKPLQAASPQRVLALNTKSMGNAHRSLRLQIEACESFSLSATAAFKQLCDVFFCTNSEKCENSEHTVTSRYPKSPKSHLSDLAASMNSELPESRLWQPQSNAAEESSGRSEAGGEVISVDAIATRSLSAEVRVTEAQDTILWGPGNDAAYTRFPSPETDNEAISRDEILLQNSVQEADWNPQLNSRHLQDLEDTVAESGNHVLTSEMHEDGDASEINGDLRCEFSPLRNNSVLSTNSTESQLDDGFEVHKPATSRSTTAALESSYAAEQPGSAAQVHPLAISEVSESNAILRESEDEHHATQAREIQHEDSEKTSRLAGGSDASCQQSMEVESTPYSSDAHSAVFSHTCTGSPPPASSSSNEVPERCNSCGPIELQPATPSFSTPVHACLTIAEVACSQTPSSGAPKFSWSGETPRCMDAPTTTQPFLLWDHNPRIPHASLGRWDSSMSSSDLPLYPAHPSKPNGMAPTPASSDVVRRLDQEFNPAVLSFASQELASRKLQPLFTHENGHTTTSSSYADENYCEEPNVPLTPSPYTLKMRSTFSRAKLASNRSNGHSVSAPLQSHYGHSEGSLLSMATAVSLSSGNRRPSIISGLPCGSPAYISVMEKQALQIVADRPMPALFTVSPMSSIISTTSSSWETATSSNASGSESSRREGSVDNYKKELENLQEQFPRAHGSFHEEHQISSGTTRIGALVRDSLQNVCKIPRQASHLSSSTTTEVERFFGATYSSGSSLDSIHISALGRATGGGCGNIPENLSNISVGYGSNGSLESDSRFDGTAQGSKMSECQVPEASLRSSSNDCRDFNKNDVSQKPSWRWTDDHFEEDPGILSSRGRASDVEVMVGSGDGFARVDSEDDDDDDDDDSSSTQREWNDILISMQQRGKPTAILCHWF